MLEIGLEKFPMTYKENAPNCYHYSQYIKYKIPSTGMMQSDSSKIWGRETSNLKIFNIIIHQLVFGFIRFLCFGFIIWIININKITWIPVETMEQNRPLCSSGNQATLKADKDGCNGPCKNPIKMRFTIKPYASPGDWKLIKEIKLNSVIETKIANYN